jgi:hypothetical protein
MGVTRNVTADEIFDLMDTDKSRYSYVKNE